MPRSTRPPIETEIVEPIDLCHVDGRLNRAAIGWSRIPLHRANLQGRGRNKRWEYWCIQTPSLVFAVTVSDLDYAALHAVWFLGPDGKETSVTRLEPLRRIVMPNRCGVAPTLVRSASLAIDLTPDAEGLRLRVRTKHIKGDIEISRPPGHQSLGVVVPWSRRRFQYTVKENTLPAAGTVIVDGRTHRISGPDAWATLDYGRGRWPYRVEWNWGSGSGRVRDGSRERVLGLQLGGRWTDGTGMTENALTVDGVLHKLGDELVWEYDPHDWLAPWRVSAPVSGRVELTFRPEYERSDRTELGLLSNRTHQCFGTWHGKVVDDDGHVFDVDGIRGWAEEVRNRW